MRNHLNKRIKKAESVYNKLQNTQKIAVMMGSVVLLFLIWWFFVFIFLGHSSKNKINISTQKIEIQLMQAELMGMQAKMKMNTDPALVADEKMKAQELKQINSDIATSSKQFVSADKLLAGLRALLREDNALELVSLNTMPTERINDSEFLTVFRSPFEMSVKGNYFQILKYFKQMEKFHAYVFWDEMTYKTLTHPDAEITLKFHILTSKPGEKKEAKKPDEKSDIQKPDEKNDTKKPDEKNEMPK